MLRTPLYVYYIFLVYIPSSDIWVLSMVFSFCPNLWNKKQIKIKTNHQIFPGKTDSSNWSLTTGISEIFIFFHNMSTPDSFLKLICRFGTGMSTIWFVLKPTVHKTYIYNLLLIITFIFSGKVLLNQGLLFWKLYIHFCHRLFNLKHNVYYYHQ